MHTPQSLHITYAFPLDLVRRELAMKRGIAYPSQEKVFETATIWRQVWQRVNQEDRVIHQLSTLTRVTLPYPIEANIIGGYFHAMSVPLIIPITVDQGRFLTETDFLNICIHELTHRFILPREDIPQIRGYWDALKERYATESRDTQNHILVYALLKLVLPTFIGEECWQACQKIDLPDYQRAFDIMEERGAEDCLREFTDHLKTSSGKP